MKLTRALKTLYLGSLLFPLAAHALPSSPVTSLTGLFDRLCFVANIIFVAAITLGVIFIIVAAYRYMVSGGDKTKVGESHQALIYGIVGIAVAIIASGMPTFVNSVLGSSATVQYCQGNTLVTPQ